MLIRFLLLSLYISLLTIFIPLLELNYKRLHKVVIKSFRKKCDQLTRISLTSVVKNVML